jgi:SHS family lactate transporter-like MFS transporter
MASSFVVYYSITSLFATHLQRDLGLSPGLVATPIALHNLIAFLAMGLWGAAADRIGRRWAMIVPACLGILVAPTYLFNGSYVVIVAGFALQGACGGAIYSQNPSYLTERFPTEVRATAAGFCYHQGAIWAGFVAPVIAYFAVERHLGFAVPMAAGTIGASVLFVIVLLLGPETKGKVLQAEIALA